MDEQRPPGSEYAHVTRGSADDKNLRPDGRTPSLRNSRGRKSYARADRGSSAICAAGSRRHRRQEFLHAPWRGLDRDSPRIRQKRPLARTRTRDINADATVRKKCHSDERTLRDAQIQRASRFTSTRTRVHEGSNSPAVSERDSVRLDDLRNRIRRAQLFRQSGTGPHARRSRSSRGASASAGYLLPLRHRIPRGSSRQAPGSPAVHSRSNGGARIRHEGAGGRSKKSRRSKKSSQRNLEISLRRIL